MNIKDLYKDEIAAKIEYFSTQPIEDASFVRCSEQCCNEKATEYTSMKIAGFTVMLEFCEKHAEQIWHKLYDLPDELPEAEARLEVRGKYRQWIVDKCPICLERHAHGGGEVGEDPNKTLGHRVAHCIGVFAEAARKIGGYTLIEKK